ncbi:MAG TPA: hypothetical protein VKW04_18135 [Planctomycetota bacterium]|nr:hypothetical protein [Planctomycetota bacterium]
MYIRTREDALENLAQILALPDRRDQIIQTTVRIMLCLEVEPRLFLADAQALLIEGGLDALRDRRRLLVEAAENLPIAFIDDAEDRLFEEIASALDALRFVDVVRQVFPAIHADRWQIARAILLYEAGIREQLSEAVRGHGDSARIDRAREAIESMITALRPSWIDRLGAIRSACLETIKKAADIDADQIHPEAESLFELFAVSDERAPVLLEAIDGDDSARTAEQILHLRELAAAARALQKDSPPTDGPGHAKEVA